MPHDAFERGARGESFGERRNAEEGSHYSGDVGGRVDRQWSRGTLVITRARYPFFRPLEHASTFASGPHGRRSPFAHVLDSALREIGREAAAEDAHVVTE